MIIKLNDKLPSVFYELESIVQEMLSHYSKAKDSNILTLRESKEFTIAGGSISNLFINQLLKTNVPIKDIDVFVPDITIDFLDSIKHVLGVEAEVETEIVNSYRESFSVPILFRFPYKGYEVEIIPAALDRIFDFDLRFRMFYFYKGNVFAHKHALTDIKERKMVLLNPKTPFNTLVRIKKFEKSLGFTLDKISTQYLNWYIAKCEHEYDFFTSYIQDSPKIDNDSKENLLAWGLESRSGSYLKPKNSDFPFYKDLEEILFSRIPDEALIGLYYDDLLNYEPFIFKSFVINPSFEKLHFNLMKTYSDLMKVVTSFGLRSTLYLDFVPDSIDEDNLHLHHNVLIGNKSIRNLFGAYNRNRPWEEQLLYEFHNTKNMPDSLEVSVNVQDDQHVPLGDILRKTSIKLMVGKWYILNLRRCTNGNYTLASVHNDSNLYASTLYHSDIIPTLAKTIPWFECYNSNLKGIYYYRGAYRYYYEHFFPGRKPAKFLLDDLKNMELIDIDLKSIKKEA